MTERKFENRELYLNESNAIMEALPSMTCNIHCGPKSRCESFEIGDDGMTTLSIKVPTEEFIQNNFLEEELVKNDCLEMVEYLLNKNSNKSVIYPDGVSLEKMFLSFKPSSEMIQLYIKHGIFTIENLMVVAKELKIKANVIEIAKAANMSIEDIVEILI